MESHSADEKKKKLFGNFFLPQSLNISLSRENSFLFSFSAIFELGSTIRAVEEVDILSLDSKDIRASGKSPLEDPSTHGNEADFHLGKILNVMMITMKATARAMAKDADQGVAYINRHEHKVATWHALGRLGLGKKEQEHIIIFVLGGTVRLLFLSLVLIVTEIRMKSTSLLDHIYFRAIFN
ncbi:hypothetical protein ACJX0J_005832 [Zea mays]